MQEQIFNQLNIFSQRFDPNLESWCILIHSKMHQFLQSYSSLLSEDLFPEVLLCCMFKTDL